MSQTPAVPLKFLGTFICAGRCRSRRHHRGLQHGIRAFFTTMQDAADLGSCNVHLTWASNAANPHSRNARMITVGALANALLDQSRNDGCSVG